MIRVDIDRRRAYLDEQEISGLRRREFDVLAFLYLNFGRVCSRPEIVASAYARYPVKPDTRAVDNAVKRLRKRLPEGAIRTIWGVGYLLETEVSAVSAPATMAADG